MNTSHWKAYIAFGAGHFLLTVFAGVFIPAWGVALADSGVTVTPWSFVAFELIGVAVSLPLVLPLTLVGFIRSWTDSGEVILVFAALANSMLVVWLIHQGFAFARIRDEKRRAGA